MGAAAASAAIAAPIKCPFVIALPLSRFWPVLRGSRATGASPAECIIHELGAPERNTLGYRLLGEHRLPLAEIVLRLNTESYPESANAFDSLGEARLAQDELAPARESYARALELAPDSDNARKMIAAIDARIAGRPAKHP